VSHGWETIRADVLRRIQAREWGPGATIPTEQALAQEFGCARATVSRALQDLAATGVLERRRKAGTRVALAPVRRATLDIPLIRQEVEGRGQSYSYRLLRDAVEVPPLPVSLQLRLPPDAPLRRLICLHFADGQPFLYEERWLNPAVIGAQQPDFAVQSANAWLVANVPYASGEITLGAAAATAADAAAFSVPVGTPLFVVDRMTWTAQAAITRVRLAYAPGYRIHTTL
jgi:GntR family histidine utilization transcriptional repressor